jgi:hypothetical protein
MFVVQIVVQMKKAAAKKFLKFACNVLIINDLSTWA